MRKNGQPLELLFGLEQLSRFSPTKVVFDSAFPRTWYYLAPFYGFGSFGLGRSIRAF